LIRRDDEPGQPVRLVDTETGMAAAAAIPVSVVALVEVPINDFALSRVVPGAGLGFRGMYCYSAGTAQS